MRYTKSQVKAIGGKRFIRKRGKRILILYALTIAWIPLVYWLITSPRIWIVLAPIGLVTLNVVWSLIQSRNLFYDKVKKNPELLDS